MKRSEEEKAAIRAAFSELTPAKKREYLFTYYKWHALIAILFLFAVYTLCSRYLLKKEPVLYVGCVNFAPGEALTEDLTEGYLRFREAGKRSEVYLYTGLYLSDSADVVNHEYAFASGMKVNGAIESKELDVVLMNREGYDLLSSKGYLLDLSAFLHERDPETEKALAPYLAENDVILSDNSLEYLLGEADKEESVRAKAANALSAGSFPVFSEAVLTGDLWIGVIANTPREEEVLSYLRYLAGQ